VARAPTEPATPVLAVTTYFRYHGIMIHTFSVSNYRSIREEVTLDLRIPRTAPDLLCFRPSTARPGVRLPAVAVLIGPNGSGKTTLLNALTDLGRIASSPTSRLPVLPFLSGETASAPTHFALEGEADFLTPGDDPRRFRYELTIGRRQEANGKTSGFVERETLWHFPNGRRRRLLERPAPSAPIYASKDFGLTARDDRLRGVERNRSAIATLALVNVPVAARFARLMGDRLLFACNLVGNETVQPKTSTVIGWLESHEDERRWARTLVRRSDLGINDLGVVSAHGNKELWFDHKGLESPILLSLESTGTKKLLHLLPLVRQALTRTRLAILDEIDGALHIDMLVELLSWFRSRDTNPRDAQLLISSHHVGLLDDLEKEEVLIVEKPDCGATRVYGAQDIRGLRRDVRLYPKYRSGMLGGLPRIG